MKKLIALLICLWIVPYCFCQTIYPSKTIINNDTLVLITPNQLTKINSIIIEKIFLQKQLFIQDSLIIFKEKIIDINTSEISNLNSIIINNDKQLENQKQLVKIQENQLKTQIKRNRRNCILYGTGGIVIGCIIGLLVSR